MPVIFFRALLKLPHTLGQNARDFFSSPLWTPVVKKTVVRHPLAKTRWHPLWTRWHPLAPVGKKRHPLAQAPVGKRHPLAQPPHAEWRRIREKPPAQNGDKERGGLGLTPRPAGTRGAQPGVSSSISLRLTWNMEAPGGFSTTRAPWAVADKMGNLNRFTGSSIVAIFGYGSSGRIFPPPPLSELLGRYAFSHPRL
jgi:hypothetical protein